MTILTGPPICPEKKETLRDKTSLSISTAKINSEFLTDKPTEALSPIQEVSTADEESQYSTKARERAFAERGQEVPTKRPYHPRYQRLTFSSSQLSDRDQSSATKSLRRSQCSTTNTIYDPKLSRTESPVGVNTSARESSGEIPIESSINLTESSRTPEPRYENIGPAGARFHGRSKEHDQLVTSIVEKTKNAKYDFLTGFASGHNDRQIDPETTKQRVNAKSYLERLAELEEVQKNGQDLMTQLADMSQTFKQTTRNASQTMHPGQDPATHRPRDTIFVANTINAGRQTIHNIEASMHESSCADSIVDDGATPASLDAYLPEESDWSDNEDIDWTLGAKDTLSTDLSSRSNRFCASMYNLENISINNYTEHELEGSKFIALPHVEMDLANTVHASSIRSILPAVSCFSTVPGSTDESAEAHSDPDPKLNSNELIPDSPTFTDFNLSFIQVPHNVTGEDTCKSELYPGPGSRKISEYKHRRTSSFYHDQWYLELDTVADRATMNTDSPKVQELVAQSVEAAEPSSRRRSNSLPMRFNGSLNWRQSLLVESTSTDKPPCCFENTRDCPQTSQDPVLDKSSEASDMEGILATTRPYRSTGSMSRVSAMSELVITREDALGIFPPYRNRVSIASRRESKMRVPSSCAMIHPEEEHYMIKPAEFPAPDMLRPAPSLISFETPMDRLSERINGNIVKPVLKRKNIRKLAIGAPQLIASSSNIPTFDLPQVTFDPSDSSSVMSSKSRSKFRNLLSSSKSKPTVARRPPTILKESTSLPVLRREGIGPDEIACLHSSGHDPIWPFTKGRAQQASLTELKHGERFPPVERMHHSHPAITSADRSHRPGLSRLQGRF